MTNKKKLSLKKETLRTLHDAELPGVAGGFLPVTRGASCLTCPCDITKDAMCELK
jgi:hypothetical protein